MATVRKRGNTYQIRVSTGYDSTGKQIEKSITWKPPHGMTEKQIAKELERQKVLFEEQVQNGLFLDSNITLAQFYQKWFTEYAEKQLKKNSLTHYKILSERTLKAIGHIRLCKLQPFHIMEFYNNLAENGVRQDIKYKLNTDLRQIFKKQGYTIKSFSQVTGLSTATIQNALNGKNVSKNTADFICKTTKQKNLFIAAEGKTTLSSSSIAEYHRFLSSMLNTAVQWQLIPYNPCQRVKPPKTERKEVTALTSEQVVQLINYLQNENLQYRVITMLALYTGLRRGELCGLEWGDIDFNNNLIKVDKSLLYAKFYGVFEDTTKNKSSDRIISIPPDMIKLLKHHKKEQAETKLKLGDLWKDTNKVFTSQYGGNINPEIISAWFKRFIRKNNLPDIHFHSLRHTAATLLIANGVDIATVSKRLGHADKTTTLNIYTHAIKSAYEEAAIKLQNIFTQKATKC